MRKFLNSFACFACIGVATMAQTTHAADPAAAGSIDAVWKPQAIVFDYRSEGRVYGCDVLEYKIGMILRRLGARDSLALTDYQCRDLADRVRVRLLLESPVAATADNVREITSYSSEEELTARLRGVRLPSATDLQRFPAAWESISFRDGKLDLEAADCALVQQIRNQVLPKMSVQVTKDIRGVDCTQEMTGIARPRLTVFALVPVTAAQ